MTTKAMIPILAAGMVLCLSTGALSADPLRFWNLTGTKITRLYLAPAGSSKRVPTNAETIPTAALIRMSD